MEIFRRENPFGEYELLDALGVGASAIVFHAVNRHTNQEVAIKIMTPDEEGEYNYQSIQSEIEFLKEFTSPFIVSYRDGYFFGKDLWIILEYCAGGAITDICHVLNISMTEDEIRDAVACVTLAIRHIHDHCCIHRDLKASNILLTADGRAVLADFGVAARLPALSKRSTVTGTPQFMSPEMVSGEGYGHATDMWSLGITILELCEGEPPNGRGSLHRILSRTISGPTPTLSNLLRWSPHLIDFLQRCLVKDESNRATCEELLFHPWIAEAVERIERVGYSSHLLSFIQMHLPSLMNHRIDATKSFKRNSRVVMIMAGQLDNQPSNIAEDERVTMEEEMDRKLKEESITEDKVSPQVTEKIYSEAEEQVRSLVTEVEIGERKVAERKSFLTSERKSEVSIIPVPGIVIKTRTSLGNKVFINLCTHPRIRVGCWTSFGECTELSTHEDEVGVSFDICCDENYLKDIETDDSNENRDKAARIVIEKLHHSFPSVTFGPEFSFPKTRGNYKGRVHPLMVDNTNLLYPTDRPIRYIGWIKSRSQRLRIWKRGFCVLENGNLLWYRDEAMSDLKRQISLKDVVIDFHADDATVPNTCARLTLHSRRYLLKFDEKITRFTWLSYLRAHEEWAHR